MLLALRVLFCNSPADHGSILHPPDADYLAVSQVALLTRCLIDLSRASHSLSASERNYSRYLRGLFACCFLVFLEIVNVEINGHGVRRAPCANHVEHLMICEFLEDCLHQRRLQHIEGRLIVHSIEAAGPRCKIRRRSTYKHLIYVARRFTKTWSDHPRNFDPSPCVPALTGRRVDVEWIDTFAGHSRKAYDFQQDRVVIP